ncbi:MAG: hypothetical protein KBD63_00900 [Bacteriovoracaceae bacterium]|nr:hypothetical protein [Bacteriovoracaceae bacterium]
MKEKIFQLAEEFTKTPHGSSDYYKDEVFVMGEKESFLPVNYIFKNIPEIKNHEDLLAQGFVFSSYNFVDESSFPKWYEEQFGKKLTSKLSQKIAVLYFPQHAEILSMVKIADEFYEALRKHHIILNGKNFPVQLGEWYAKTIFGLQQVKSISQRGFDFTLDAKESKKIEVKIHWSDTISPKGVKLKKSLLELSDACILVYVNQNFLIRDICFLDSEFVLRKFDDKGHTIFLKDADLAPYFFTKSGKHFDKIKNKSALLKFATSQFLAKLEGRL